MSKIRYSYRRIPKGIFLFFIFPVVVKYKNKLLLKKAPVKTTLIDVTAIRYQMALDVYFVNTEQVNNVISFRKLGLLG